MSTMTFLLNLIMISFGFSSSQADEVTKDVKPLRKPASVYASEVQGIRLKPGTIVKIWDEEMKIVCYAASGDTTSAPSGSGSSIYCLQK